MMTCVGTFATASMAQTAAQYTFAQSSGTYTAISGGSVLVSGVGSATAVDDAVYAATIPFSFTFGGVAYTNMYASTNGFISFGTTAPSTTTYSPISTTSTGQIVSAMSRDLAGRATVTADIRVETVGTAPNRTTVIQWTNFARYVSGGATDQNLNFQIRLNETANTVDIVYNVVSATNTSLSTTQVGLRGTTTSVYNNRTSSTTWAATTAGASSSATVSLGSGVAPAAGLTFSYAPPPPCSGTPTAGTAASSVSTACPTTSVVLTLTGYSSGVSNIGIQWQSSPAGAGTWTNIAGATNASYTGTQAASTDYQAVVTCSTPSVGGSATSNVVSVTQNGFLACYCASSPSGATADDIFEVNINGTNNVSTCATTGGGASVLNRYSDYTSLTPIALTQLAKDTLTVISGGCATNTGMGVGIYIDYNHDGVYGTGEKVYSSGSSTTAAKTGTFIVPVTAMTGITGMRVVGAVNTSGSSVTACSTTFTSGEVEDYLVNISAAPVCSGAPAPGTTTSSADTVDGNASATLNISNGVLTTTGTTYQWYVSTDNVTFDAIAGATNTSYSGVQQGSINGQLIYYYYITATCSGNSTNSSTKQVVVRKAVHCLPTTTRGCGDGDVIARVKVNTLDKNSGTGCPSDPIPKLLPPATPVALVDGGEGPGYSNYYDSTGTGMTTTLAPARTYAMKVWAGQWSEGYAAWIDYNDDGAFDNATERVGFSNGQVAGSNVVGQLGDSATFNITLSCTPPAGQHRMRVRCMFNTSGSAVTPCGNNVYGEVEDYKVTITAQAACAPGAPLEVRAVTHNSITIAFNKGCATATNYDFNFGVSPYAQGAAGGTTKSNVATTANAAGDTLFYTITGTGVNPNTNYDIYYRARCGGTPATSSVWSTVAANTTTLPAPCSGTPTADTAHAPAAACAGTPFTLSATGQSTSALGFTYQWQSSTDGTTWSNIVGETGATASVSQTVASMYRHVTTCSNSSLSAASLPVSVAMDVKFNCYCTARATNINDAELWKISVGTSWSNASNCASSDKKYSNYDTIAGPTVRAGATVAANFYVGTCNTISYSGFAKVFVDWNQDGDLTDAGEEVYASAETVYTLAGVHITGSFTVPSGAMLGATRMRVMFRELDFDQGDVSEILPCDDYGYGETEDYIINVVAGPGCTAAPAAVGTVTPSSATKVCAGDTRSYSVVAAANVDYYNWTKPDSAVIVSGQGTNTVTVRMLSGFPNPGDTLRVTGTNLCGTSAIQKKQFIAWRGLPKQPGTIGVDTSAKVCGGEMRIFRTVVDTFTTSIVWTAPTGATIVTGQNNDTVRMSFNSGFTMTDTVRVVAKNGCGTSLERKDDVAWRGVPKAPGTIYADTSLAICPGETRVYRTVIDATSNSTSILWTVPTGVTIASGQNNDTITANFGAGFAHADTIKVTSTNGCGTSLPKSFVAKWRGAPKTPGTLTQSIIDKPCPGESRTYSFELPVPFANSYTWSVPGGATVATVTGGQNTQAATILFNSGFTQDTAIQVTATNTCGTSLPKVKKVADRGVPKAPSGVVGNLYGLCGNTAEAYSVLLPVVGADSYQWSFTTDGTVTSGQGTTGITANFPSSFVTTVLSVGTTNGCGTSATVKSVVINGKPNKAVVTGPVCGSPNTTAAGYGATAYGADSMIWAGPTGSRVNLAGATTNLTNMLRTLASATVDVRFGATVGTVKATALNGCGVASATSYAVTACARMTEEASAFDVELVPNPATDQVSVRVNSSVDAKAEVRIMSVTGQLMMTEVMPTAQHGQLVLPISNLAAGMYMVEVTVDGQKMTKQLIKN
jgi:hypothetical protein